jgi:hypothetical protein
MAARKKRTTKTVADENYSKLDEHSIWLNEYYKSLRRAGFSVDNALWLISTKDSYPDWVNPLTQDDIKKHLEEEDE